MRFATWNVNSLRVRMPHVLEWLKTERPDVLALQETKLPDDVFPLLELKAAGYEAICSGQRAYNGVAILSRDRATDVVCDIPEFPDPQKRVVAATINGVRVISVYVPNGERISSPKYVYKLDWMAQLEAYFRAELARHPMLVAVGDFNVAPEERDVHDPIAWQGRVLFSEPERAAFQRFLAIGLFDAFRLFDQSPGEYTWWDYGVRGFPKNRGLRIDHVLVSDALRLRCRECRIDRTPRGRERPSDHAPVVATFD